MNRNHHVVASEKHPNFACQIIERISMLSKNDELFPVTVCILHQLVILKNRGKFVPFPIRSTHANLICHAFQHLELCNFHFEFGNCCRSRCLVCNRVLLRFQFVRRQIVQIILIVRQIKLPCCFRCSFSQFFRCKTGFKPLSAAIKRLINCLRRRSQASLQNRQSESDR